MRAALLISCVAVALIAGCGDDDDSGPAHDAGDAASGRGGRDASTSDAGPGGGGVGGGGRSGEELGDCSAYPWEVMSLWSPPGDDDPDYIVRRATLAELCQDGCRGTLADAEAALRCTRVPDDGGVESLDDAFDGGIGDDIVGDRFVLRSEGCGSVQLTNLQGRWRSASNYDAETGEQIGLARHEEEPWPLPNGSGTCNSKGWIAGTFLTSCAEEALSLCERRR